ncbi:MAG: hypothetical protein ABI548_07210 [Polyangiaceae bacterium]
MVPAKQQPAVANATPGTAAAAADAEAAARTAPVSTPVAASSASVPVPVTCFDRFRACFNKPRGVSSLVLHPSPLFTAASPVLFFSQVRGEPSHLGPKDSREKLCSWHPPASLCVQSACTDSAANLIWYPLRRDGPRREPTHKYRALMTLFDATGTARGYAAGYTFDFDSTRCLTESGEPNCGPTYLELVRTGPASMRLGYHFYSGTRMCNDIENEQTWVLDDEGLPIAVLEVTPGSGGPSVTVTESAVQVKSATHDCSSEISRAELAAQPPEGMLEPEWL